MATDKCTLDNIDKDTNKSGRTKKSLSREEKNERKEEEKTKEFDQTRYRNQKTCLMCSIHTTTCNPLPLPIPSFSLPVTDICRLETRSMSFTQFFFLPFF